MIKEDTTDNYTIRLNNQLNEISRIAEAIKKLSVDWNIESKQTQQINLAIEEVVSNIILYAYGDLNTHEIYITLQRTIKGIIIKIIDDGKYFNLLELEKEVDVKAPIEEREVGGLGIYILKNLVDKIDYRRNEGRNEVELIKYF